MALPQSDVGDGNLLRTADCDVEANDNQRWQFSGGQLVYAAEPSRCVDLRYDGRPQIWECTGAPQQQMQHNPDERTITFSSPHRCLGVGVNGVRPRSFACDGDARLLWVVSNDEEMPAPAPPSPPPPSGAGYQCDVCFHVYDAEQDGGGLAFEDLPEDWTCPICAQPKSHYKMVQPETTAAPAPASQFKCTVCAHVYDPASDGNGLAFEELPDDWTCPVCAQPKSAYEPVAPAPAPATQFKCSICAHVYDPASDGNGLAFEELPDDWTCPVCAQPKSAYQPVAPAPAPASQFKCSICAHIYDPVSDGNGLAFEELPDDWTCPVCAQPKSAYAPVAGTALVAQKQTMQPISV